MAHTTIAVEATDGSLWIRLDRPARANAVDAVLCREVTSVLQGSRHDESVRSIVIIGNGRNFSGGADLRSNDQADLDAGTHPLGALCLEIERTPLPVIAAINGPALGGGLELALACDLRYMSDTAAIGLPEIRFGQLPGFGGTQRLPRLIGASATKEMVLTGQPIPAEEAWRLGAINRVVPHASLESEVRALADVLARRPRYALAAGKHLVDQGLRTDLAEGLELEHRTIHAMASPQEKQHARESAAVAEDVYRSLFTPEP